ncbi:MAG: outer membrane beta-barrel protein [Prolixibacteraceae bacterium]|nr:outer membrane beta-barrel protein [Prolixibacteraceae bacterium]
MMNKKYISLLLILFPVMLFSQTGNMKQTWHKDWNFGVLGGMSYFGMEMKKDFSRLSMDMNSNPTATFAFHLDKRFESQFGVGIEFEKNFFSGSKTYPDKIIWLKYDSRFNNEYSSFVAKPIYFKTNVTTFFLNITYNFNNFIDEMRVPSNYNMYIKLGAGLSTIGVELGYKDPLVYEEAKLPNPIYEKGQGIQSIKDVYPSYHAGTGLNYYISPRISLNAEVTFLFVGNDYIDGIHNYEATYLPDDKVAINRQPVYGVVGEIKFGATFHFNLFKRTLYNGLWENKIEEFRNPFYKAVKEESKVESK